MGRIEDIVESGIEEKKTNRLRREQIERAARDKAWAEMDNVSDAIQQELIRIIGILPDDYWKNHGKIYRGDTQPIAFVPLVKVVATYGTSDHNIVGCSDGSLYVDQPLTDTRVGQTLRTRRTIKSLRRVLRRLRRVRHSYSLPLEI